jgi:Na+-transporting methylmalonyl-CoA/oxaloacetate decarboxylase gamma subunit
MILGLEVVTLVLFLFLSAMKFMTYHDALTRYYRHHVQ